MSTFGSPLFGGGSGSVPAGATICNDILNAALRKAGVTIAPGRKPAPEQTTEAIKELNRFIGTLNLSELNIFTNRIDLWPTVANQQSYTIGIDPRGVSTADWDGPRPQKIVRANFLLPTADDPITKVRRKLKLWTDKEWAEITFQAVYTYPEGLYNDGDYPFSRIYFRPIPDAVYQIELFTWQSIPKFSTVDDFVLLPDGYEAVLVDNLAVRLASMPWTVKRPMDPQVERDAARGLRLIRSKNATCPQLSTDPELRSTRGTYNWLSGLDEE